MIMTKQMILYMLIGFLSGCMFCVISSGVGEAIRRRRNKRRAREIDSSFDQTNFINQKQHQWEPYKVEDTVLYRLR